MTQKDTRFATAAIGLAAASSGKVVEAEVRQVRQNVGDLFAGKFIVFEGIDGSGKDTVRAEFVKCLEKQGVRVQIFNDPGSTNVGHQIRNILLSTTLIEMHKGTELLLYVAARAELLYQRILPCIEEGICVVCNRWVYATLAYQGAGNGADVEVIKDLHQTMCGGFMPHMALLIDVPVEVGLERCRLNGASLDRIEERFIDEVDSTYYVRVRASYLRQSQKNMFDASGLPMLLIDGTVPLNVQVDAIWTELVKAFEASK